MQGRRRIAGGSGRKREARAAGQETGGRRLWEGDAGQETRVRRRGSGDTGYEMRGRRSVAGDRGQKIKIKTLFIYLKTLVTWTGDLKSCLFIKTQIVITFILIVG